MIPITIAGVVTNVVQQTKYPNVTAVLYSGTSPEGRVKRSQSTPTTVTGAFQLSYVPAQIPAAHNLYLVFEDGSGRELVVVGASAELAFPRPPAPNDQQPPTVVNASLQPPVISGTVRAAGTAAPIVGVVPQLFVSNDGSAWVLHSEGNPSNALGGYTLPFYRQATPHAFVRVRFRQGTQPLERALAGAAEEWPVAGVPHAHDPTLVFPPPTSSTTLSGTLTDQETSAPYAGVTVRLVGLDATGAVSLSESAPTTGTGTFSVTYDPATATYDSAALQFFAPDGRELDVVTSTAPTGFVFAAPPTAPVGVTLRARDVTGSLTRSSDGSALSGVTPEVQVSGGGTWLPHATGAQSTSSGAYRVPFPERAGTDFTQVRIVFRDTDGIELEALSAGTTWHRSEPPHTLDVVLRSEAAVEETAGGYSKTPPTLRGTVLDEAGTAHGRVVVELWGTTARRGEVRVATTTTNAAGRFVLDSTSVSGVTDYRVAFGPPHKPFEIVVGPETWPVQEPPAAFDYRAKVPASKAPATPGSSVDLKGMVRHVDGSPLPASEPGRADIRLLAYSYALGQPRTQIGAAILPGSDGRYAASLPVSGTDLTFRVVVEAQLDGVVWEEVAASKLVPYSPEDVIIDVAVHDRRLSVASEAAETDPVDVALNDAGVTDPDLVTEDDEEVLSERLDIPLERVRCRMAGRRLKKVFEARGGPVIDLAVYYGLLCLGYPRRPRAFARRAKDRARDKRTLTHAVEVQLIGPVWVSDAVLPGVLDALVSLIGLWDRAPLIEGTLAHLVREASSPSQLTDAQIETFVDRWHAAGDTQTFWDDLQSPLPSGWTTTTLGALRRAVAIVNVADRNLATIRAFQGAHPSAPASWTAELTLAGWQGPSGLLATVEGADLPTFVQGDTVEDRRDAWGEKVFRRAEAKWRFPALRGAMLDAIHALPDPPQLGGDDMTAVEAFLQQHRVTTWHAPAGTVELDLGAVHLATFFTTHTVTNAVLQAHLRALQRLYALLPRRDGWSVLEGLWRAGFRSARDVSRLGMRRFTHRMEATAPPAPQVDRPTLKRVWMRARRRAQRAGAVFKDNHPHRPRSPSGPFAPAGPSGAGTKPEAAAELDALYTQALCGCEHCQSVLGPAAYFVDTLFWLQGLDPAAYTELVSRRPDLPALELDCENTETALPYSDLVIEVLEQLVSPDHELDTLPTGTERETEVLLAYPEHGDRLAADRAYTALKQTFHPRLLPYDLALDEVQTYLGHLGVPHVTLIDAFGDLATSTVTAAERAVLGLGGTRAGAAAFTSDTYTSSPESHWGGTPSTWGEDLDQVSVLLERGQIDDADLVLDLLVTRYLNGDDSVGIRLEDAALDACDPANLFLRQDRGTADPANPYPPEDWFYQRLAAFLRLVQWTGWSALDLDKALHALGVERSEPGGTGAGPTPVIQIDGAVLEGLHAQQRLLELTGLDPAELFSWWRGLDTHLDRDNRQADAVVPWYDRTFLDPFTVGTDGEAAFALNAARSELLSPDAVTSPLVHHSAVLSAALGVSETELLHAEEVVTADVGAPGLDLAGLWHLFRWTSLAKAAGLTVREVDLWRTIMGAGSDPFPAGVDDPRRAVRWFEGLQALRTFALDVGEVAWIFGHHADAVATHGPTDAANEALLTTLREALQQLEADQLEPVVDDPTVRAALEEQGVLSDVIDAVIRIIAWDWSDLVPAPATDPSSLPERDATLAQIEHAVDDLDALKSDLRTSLPTAPVAPETFEERLGVLFGHMAPVVAATREREEILAVLEGSYPALTRAHVDVIDAESFSALAGATDPVDALRLDTTLGVTADESATAHQALHLVAKLAHLTQALQLDADSLSEWLVEGTVFGAPDLSGLPVAEDLGALADLWLPLQSALAWFGLDHTLPGTTGAGPEVRSAMREGAALAALSTVSDHLQLDTTSLASLLQAVDARAGAPTAVVAHLALADEGALTASFTVDGHTVTASVTTADPDALLAALASAVASNPDLAWLTAATVDTAGTVVPAGIESLRLSTTSAEHSPFDVSSTSLDVQQGLRDLALLDAVMTRWRHLGTLGVDVATAVSWVTAEPTRAAAAEIRRLARSRAASSAAWSEVGRGLRDDIRRRQQAALFAKVRNDDPTIQSDAAFYAKYLIDPEMDPCMLTSRLKLAISSVQTFVNQCLLGQVTDGAGEPIPFLDSDDETEWRTWRGSYRMWEAARKVYLFPENWLDPSVRVERSPEFERLEDRIRVQTLDAKAADEALATYLREVLPLANPLLACMTHDAEGNIHLLGRAGSQAEKPMYRVARTLPTKNRWRWGAWEQLPFPVPTDERTRVAMYVHGGDVLLVWASLQGEDELGYATELSVFFAIRSQGHWSSPQQAHMQSIDGMDTLDLQMYHHGSAGTLVGWTTLDAVPEGVYAAIAYRDSDGAHGGVALLWSPTLRRFVPNGNMGAQLGNGNLVFEVLSELDAPDIYVPDGDARIRLYHPERSCIAALTLSTPVGAGATSTFDVVDGCIQSSQNGQFENSYAETQDFYADRGFRFESDESSSGGGSITEASMASDVLVLEGDSLEDVALLSPWSDRDALLFPPNFAEWKTQVPFAVLYDTKSYLAVLTTSFGTSLDGDLIERGFSLQSLHHSFLPNFVEAMDASGPDGLYGLEDGSQLEHQRISSREPFEEIELTHTSVVAQDPADPNPSAPQSDVVGFSSWSPHRLYNWELFVHIPLRIAERLREEGKYADALTWLHRVLDPSWASQPYASTPTTDANEAWRPRPLFDPLPFTDPELKAELWADGPFDVHAVAENDPEVYRFAVARQYVETLTAWGDHLFARDSIESIAEATQIYLYAQQFLGPRPTRLELQTDRGSGLTFAQLLTANGSGGSTADGLFNPLTELENVLTEEHSSVPTIRVDAASIDPGDMTGYFCTPDNHRHLQLWDVLEDRLHKIRHCMNIQGIVRVLPLFEPPIDPGALVAAAAAGLDLSQVAATRWVSPHIRFPAMMALARSLAQSLQRLGGALQQALQSQDAEALTMLRQAHEVELLELAEDVRRGQVAEATLSQESLEESKKITAFRRDHFAELIDVGPLATEYAEQTLQIVSQGLRTTIGIMRGTAAVMGAIPRFHAQAGFAIGPSFGNPELTEPSKSGGDALAAVADVLGIAANLSGVAGRWKRRKQDWQLSLGMAERELTQLDVQIEAAAERLAIAKQELANHKRQIEQSREVEAVLRSRFSSEDLFGWMVGELTHLHSQSYHLAVEVARKAELCLRREIGLKATSYVGAHHFNASRKGLLAGDRLLADLDRMEVAYVELDRREHEITKHVSLKRLDPQALIRLQRDGACTFSIPEVLYDLDFPGHYKRRIKAVSVSIPCVTGPFASVNGTLTLLRSQVRTDTAVMDTYEDAANYSHERWMEQVALSGGQDDSGTFNFDLRDAKYLRFEHRGAVSEWSLELAGSTTGTDGVKRPQFDWSSIADVVLHVRYTARHDSSLQPTAIDGVKAALDKIRADSEGMQLALSFAHDAPDAWHAALTADASTSVQMQMPLDWDRLPYLVQALNPTVSAARPILIAPASPDVTTAISVQGATTHSFGSATVDMPFGDGAFWTAAELVGATASPGPDEQLTVELSDPGLANVTTAGSLDTSKLEDVIVLLTLDFDPSV